MEIKYKKTCRDKCSLQITHENLFVIKITNKLVLKLDLKTFGEDDCV